MLRSRRCRADVVAMRDGGRLSVDSARVADLAAATRNRGDRHVVLGSPWSDGVDKTVVEPGGSFSPGVWTCGISVWTVSDGAISSPDLFDSVTPDFGFHPLGRPPIIRSTWRAHGRRFSTELATLRESDETADVFRLEVRDDNQQQPTTGLSVHLVVRGAGPAGGLLTEAAWVDGALEVGGGRRVIPSPPPDHVHVHVAEPRPDGS